MLLSALAACSAPSWKVVSYGCKFQLGGRGILEFWGKCLQSAEFEEEGELNRDAMSLSDFKFLLYTTESTPTPENPPVISSGNQL